MCVASSHVRLIKRSSQSQLREDRPASLNQFGRFLTFYVEKYGLEPGLDPNNRVRLPQMSRLLNMTSSLVSHYVSREFDHCMEHICKQFPHIFEDSNCVYDDSISKVFEYIISFETINFCNCYELHCYCHHITEGGNISVEFCLSRPGESKSGPWFRLGHIPPLPALSTCLTTQWTDVHTHTRSFNNFECIDKLFETTKINLMMVDLFDFV